MISLKSLLHLRQKVITFRTWLHLGLLQHLSCSTPAEGSTSYAIKLFSSSGHTLQHMLLVFWGGRFHFKFNWRYSLRMSRCFALVTVVINFISRNHAFTVKRALITYGKEYQRLELLFAVKSFHGESVIQRGVKALHFRLWFHQTCTRFWNKISYSIKQTLWPTVRREHWTAG